MSLICAGLIHGKCRNRPDFVFSCAFLMQSQSVCLTITQKTHIYTAHLCLSLSLSLQFSFFSVSQRFVERYFKPFMLIVGTRFSSGFLQSHQSHVTLLYPIFLFVSTLSNQICSQTNSTVHIVSHTYFIFLPFYLLLILFVFYVALLRPLISSHLELCCGVCDSAAVCVCVNGRGVDGR